MSVRRGMRELAVSHFGPVPRQIGFHHHPDQLLERDARRPSQHASRLRRIRHEQIHFRRSEKFLVLDHVVLVIQPGRAEGDFAQLANRARHSHPDNVVVRRGLLQHQPHRLDIVAGESPVTPCVEVSESQFRLKPEFDPGDTVGDLARDELQPPSRALVVEENTGHRVHAEALAIVDGDPVAVDLRHAVRTSRIERRRLPLRRLDHLPEHLARAGLIESGIRRSLLRRLEHPCDTESGELAGQDGLCPRRTDEALRREIVDLVGLMLPHRVDERMLVEQVRGDELHVIHNVGDALECGRRASPNHADDAVALVEQQLGQVGPVLSGDPRD